MSVQVRACVRLLAARCATFALLALALNTTGMHIVRHMLAHCMRLRPMPADYVLPNIARGANTTIILELHGADEALIAIT